MSDISSNPYLNSLLIDSAQTQSQVVTDSGGSNNELGQTAFLELMITQLENQSPLDPQDNTEFVAQLAQFSSVEGIDRLNNSFDNFSSAFMSNQALQASSLVGTSVAVPATQAQLYEDSYIGGSIDLPATTTDMSISIYNEQGALVDQIDVGALPAGEIAFRWNGSRLEIDGELLDWESTNPVTSGTYRFEVIATQDGQPQQLDTALTANVNSVTIDSNNQMILNLAGVGPVSISDVKQFN